MALFSYALLFLVFQLRYQVIAWQCSSCEVPYRAKGCYRDYSNRGLKVHVLNERDRNSRVFGGHLVDWKNWNTYMPGFACRCAKLVKARGWTVFGLQYYGECWSGPPGSFDPNTFKETDKCVAEDYNRCGKLDRHCVGEKWTNFVFEIASECDLEFERLGCFRDNHRSPRPLPDYILTDRDAKHKQFSGQLIDWRNWDVYLPNFVCRCAKLAKLKGHNTFGVQYYGECWSGKDADFTYSRLGRSSNCQDTCFQKCQPYKKYCAGKNFANAVYRLSDAPCEVSYETIGCYAEQLSGRALNREILNQVNPTSPLFSGQLLSFGDEWSNEFDKFLCRCGRAAQQKGYTVFGVNNHGICWSSPYAAQRYNIHGPSNQCYMKYNQTCPAGSDACAGGADANYVYRIVMNSRLSTIESDTVSDVTSTELTEHELPQMRDETSRAQQNDKQDDMLSIENILGRL